MKAIISTLALLVMAGLLYAEPDFTANSAEHKTALLELYTSEGCNSCPPADKWIGSLSANGYSTEQVIPIALHVDYWDYLGWRDIYADPEYSKRQRRHVIQNRLSTAYTPQLILNGQNLRPSKLLSARLHDINQEKADVGIVLTAKTISDSVIQLKASVTADSNSLEKNPQLYIALLSDKITSSIAAGENAGRTLTHHHVARALHGPFAVKSSGTTHIQKEFKLPEETTLQDSSIVAFIQTPEQKILQAVRLELR